MLIRRSDGTPQEIIGLWTDVTAQRQADGVLRRQADIINQIQETVISIDLDGYVMSWNKGAGGCLDIRRKRRLANISHSSTRWKTVSS